MNQCKSVQKYFLNKGKRTSVKGIKHEDKKTFWNKIWNNKTTWHLLAYGFIKTTVSARKTWSYWYIEKVTRKYGI